MLINVKMLVGSWTANKFVDIKVWLVNPLVVVCGLLKFAWLIVNVLI